MKQKNKRTGHMRKGKCAVLGGIGVFVILAFIGCLFVLYGKKERVVGTDIGLENVSEFYYTRSSSTNPPHYQRYHFYMKDGNYTFYHEKREGAHWPLTESDITVSGTQELTKEAWNDFFKYLIGGKVHKRDSGAEAGDSGPWTYIYWDSDKGKYQQFSFASLHAQSSFEAFCEELVEEEASENSFR